MFGGVVRIETTVVEGQSHNYFPEATAEMVVTFGNKEKMAARMVFPSRLRGGPPIEYVKSVLRRQVMTHLETKIFGEEPL